MRALITGGAGFIGSHTADALLSRGHDVRLLDNLQRPVHLTGKPSYLAPEAEFIFGDIRDRDVLLYALRDADVVYHFAAYQDYLPDFSTYFDVNAVGTALVYELVVAHKLPVKRIIVASSQAVLGEGQYRCLEHGICNPDIRVEADLARGQWDHLCRSCGRPMESLSTPEASINPQNQYALSKHSTESIAISLGRRYGIPSVAMRYSIVQGPRQSFYNAYSGAMRIFALHLYFGKPPMLYEDGRQLRDYVNIQDVVDANLLVLEHPGAVNKVFNVGGGTAYSVSQFYEALQNAVGRRIPPIVGANYRYGDTRHICSDIGALRSLGWSPKRSIQDSIAAYWQYLNAQQNVDDILEHAERTMRSLNVVRTVAEPVPKS